MTAPPWTRGEMLAVAASSFVRGDDVVLVGLGLPQVAVGLAQQTHAPGARLLLELGVFDPQLGEPGMGVADPRLWRGATMHGGMVDALGRMLHGGRVSLGMLGALQVDPRGSVNTTLVDGPDGPDGAPRRFNGSGGGNDIASSAGRVVVVMRHDDRKFRDAVRFLTSPGRTLAGGPRASVGLRGAGTVAVVTDRAVLRIDEDGAVLQSVHEGERPDRVLAATPMTVGLPPGGVAATPPPTEEQLRLVREQLDPQGWYTS